MSQAQVTPEEAYYVVLRTVVAGNQANWVSSTGLCSCFPSTQTTTLWPYGQPARLLLQPMQLFSLSTGQHGRHTCLQCAMLWLQNVMGHMAQLRKLMGVSDDMHKVRAACVSCAFAAPLPAVGGLSLLLQLSECQT